MKKVNPRYIPLAATALVMIALFTLGALRFPGFFSLRVVVNLLGDNAFLGVAAIGATFVILSGGIDLSVGSVIAFTGILIASLVAQGWDPLLAMTVALLAGTVFGAVMGWLIHAFELPPFLVTLGGMFFMRGLSFVVHEQSMAIKHPFYLETLPGLAIPLGQRLSMPFTATCFVVAVVLATLLSVYTRFGRNVYALGSDEPSARLMGVPVGRTKVMIYALAGFFSAAGGCVATFYMQSGNPASFIGLELDAIASVVIGGTLLTGGVGFIPGTMMGVLIRGLIYELINWQGTLSSWWTAIAVGVLLLLFIVLQKAISSRADRAG